MKQTVKLQLLPLHPLHPFLAYQLFQKLNINLIIQKYGWAKADSKTQRLTTSKVTIIPDLLVWKDSHPYTDADVCWSLLDGLHG